MTAREADKAQQPDGKPFGQHEGFPAHAILARLEIGLADVLRRLEDAEARMASIERVLQ